MKPHLPGLPTMSALLLVVILVAWLGLWGPINLDRLKDWQTLLAAIIAPSIALYAATIAYRGAMAKVNLDRAEADRKRLSEQLGLLLRLRLAVERVQLQAWARLDLFPEVLITEIEVLRRLLPAMQGELERFKDQTWKVDWVRAPYSFDLPGVPAYRQPVPDEYLVLYARRCERVSQSCGVLYDGLSSAIESLRN